MRLLKQLELAFEKSTIAASRGAASIIAGRALRLPNLEKTATGAVALQFQPGRDCALEVQAGHLLHTAGADRIASEVRVEWNPRLKSAAGRADYRAKLVSLNPRLAQHGEVEIGRTLRHELAHLLAQFRAGRRRILPHGAEWREACRDLGIADETRCHALPFPTKSYAARLMYRCPHCRQDFPRVRRARRAVACLACCRAYNRGEFDARFKLRLCSGGL